MYNCVVCGDEFEEDWTDEEAQVEMKENFGENITKEDCEVVCDDCYEKIKPSKHPEILALAKFLEIMSTHYLLFTEHDNSGRPSPYCAVYYGSSFDIDELKERFILETKGTKKAIIYKTCPSGKLIPVQDFWTIWGDCHGNPIDTRKK